MSSKTNFPCGPNKIAIAPAPEVGSAYIES